jgi:cytochrome c
MAKMHWAAAAALGLWALTPAMGDCPLQAVDFKATELFNKSEAGGARPALAHDTRVIEPIQFALQGVKADGKLDHVDVYFVQRTGDVNRYDGATHTVHSLGKIKVYGRVDSGLMGIALDPDFETNHWMYLWYVPTPDSAKANRHLKLGRFTVTGDALASEKVLLDIKGSVTDNYHSGGPMTFDAYGDLWIQVGNNSDDVDVTTFSHYSNDSAHSEEWGASNTANLRGGTLRIHPDNSAKGYSIPEGNFGKYWSDYWKQKGVDSLAQQYADTSRVLPEIYVKGDRSNYSIAVHPTKRWLGYGTVNDSSSYDEFNLTGHPAFMGFPYFHANNERVIGQMQMLKFLEDPAKPINISSLKGKGVRDLPPATPGAVSKLVNVAIGGPFYLFDPALDSKTKFPPQMHNKWFGFSWKNSVMYMFTLDTNSLKVTDSLRIDKTLFGGVKLLSPLSAKFGPDGSMYILNYDGGNYTPGNTGVTRVDYTGGCVSPVRPEAGNYRAFSIKLSPARLEVDEAGAHEFSLFDLRGHRLLVLRGKQGAEYSFDKLRAELKLEKGVHLVRVQTARGLFTGQVSFL